MDDKELHIRRMWNGAGMAYFKLISQHLVKETEKTIKNLRIANLWAKNRSWGLQNRKQNN